MHLKMDLQYFAGEKTEEATPKKKSDERRKGRVAKSQDINTAVLLLFTFGGLFVFGGNMLDTMIAFFTGAFTETIDWNVTLETVPTVFNTVALEAAKMLAPIMILAIIAGFASNFMQFGFLFSTEPLKFDLKKINPISGFKRIFSMRSIVELMKSFLKIFAVGFVTVAIIWMSRDDVLMLVFHSTETALATFSNIAIRVMFAAAAVILVLAILDYVYQRYDFAKNLRMSKQDIKDEYKNMEGDPLIKSKMRERQRAIATGRMMAEVPQADVVITNPTHYSVAIKYDEEKAAAPIVVAKGVDLIALRIREIAKEHDVAIVENRLLARGLHASVEIDQEIPEEFYQQVAEVLAYIYRLENKV